jgi:Sulfotransferase domain
MNWLTYLTLPRISLLLRKRRVIAEDLDAPPTIFHITVYKAGSQWIYNILLQCVPDRLVRPKLDSAQFVVDDIIPGKIYPTVYLPRTLFYRKSIPSRSKHFVVLRDLRDILVSGYFSLTSSHLDIGNVSLVRRKLSGMSKEDGFLWMIRQWMPWNALIFETWVKSGEPWIRYEDLLVNDIQILEDTLLNRCKLEVSKAVLRQAIINCRFEALSGGRSPGAENLEMHYRKGIAGDWKNHFTKKVKEAFKRRYGKLLVLGGYEADLQW